ncbi:hypothetical protein G5714_001578 [Onychostoma macrolepis]|uniref:Uncharacterized protein n=1 Tax=Onychostoma macrolepis TaxID=369639 RepID=A0A7J6DDB1_9TELE|nr:hypothetical protein G5714_001578 [Onychostoma macrolepis]
MEVQEMTESESVFGYLELKQCLQKSFLARVLRDLLVLMSLQSQRLQRFWRTKRTQERPVCRRRSSNTNLRSCGGPRESALESDRRKCVHQPLERVVCCSDPVTNTHHTLFSEDQHIVRDLWTNRWR